MDYSVLMYALSVLDKAVPGSAGPMPSVSTHAVLGPALPSPLIPRFAAIVVLGCVLQVALAQPVFDQVSAIFEERCTLCHSGDAAPLGLQLVDFELVMAGSVNGPVVQPGDPEASELVRRIEGRSLPRMPLTGPPFLDESQIELIREWVQAGAQGPDGPAEDPAAGDANSEVASPASTESGVAADSPGTSDSDETVAIQGGFGAVQPILQSRCVKCHTDDGLLGAPPEGLRLDSYEAILRGGERVVVVPGAPLASELFRRVVGHSLPRMPLDGPPYLSQPEIESIRAWIEEGAPDGDGSFAGSAAGGEVRLHGVLTGRWELDGLELQVSGNTRLDDDPTVGDYVEVRGVILPGGSIRAERIRPR